MSGSSKINMPGSSPYELEYDRPQLKIQSRNDLLHSQSRRHLWEFMLFLLLSLAALMLHNINLHERFSEGVRQLIGCPLPTSLLSFVLVCYGFSTLILMLTRGETETRIVKRWFHFSFRVAFYLFYGFSGALSGHFLFVFSLGLFLYVSEQVSTWFSQNRGEELEGELVEEP